MGAKFPSVAQQVAAPEYEANSPKNMPQGLKPTLILQHLWHD